MSESDDRANALDQQVSSAFYGVARPKAGTLFAVRFAEEPEAEHVFGRKRWQDLTVRDLRDYAHTLSLMTPRAFRFILPAYLIAVLKQPSELDTGCGSLCWTLALSADKSPHHRRYAHEQSSALTDAQRDVVREVLRFLAELWREDDPSEPLEALDSCWAQA